MFVNIVAKFKNGGVGTICLKATRWIPFDMSCQIPSEAVPSYIHKIELWTDSGLLFRQIDPSPPLVTLMDHLRHWWSINLGCSQ
jgi:hypothetical protein